MVLKFALLIVSCVLFSGYSVASDISFHIGRDTFHLEMNQSMVIDPIGAKLCITVFNYLPEAVILNKYDSLANESYQLAYIAAQEISQYKEVVSVKVVHRSNICAVNCYAIESNFKVSNNRLEKATETHRKDTSAFAEELIGEFEKRLIGQRWLKNQALVIASYSDSKNVTIFNYLDYSPPVSSSMTELLTRDAELTFRRLKDLKPPNDYMFHLVYMHRYDGYVLLEKFLLMRGK